jgi:hypothetical protein
MVNNKITINKEQSPRYKLNKHDMKKLGKSALIAFGGFTLAFITDIIPMIDWGDYKPIIVAVSSVLVAAGLKLINGEKKKF